MKDIVTIYALVDPISLKIRYIGRTRSSLQKRLQQHVCKAKKNYDCNTHKGNWIRKLIKMNSKPFIRKLTTVIGWVESYEFEKALINKYKNRLTNHDDRGEGGINKVITQNQRDKISKSLSEYYSNPENLHMNRKIYVYNYDGTFYKEFPSIEVAAKELGIFRSTIFKYLGGHIGKRRPWRIKLQFSYEKVESMRDWTKIKKVNRRFVW